MSDEKNVQKLSPEEEKRIIQQKLAEAKGGGGKDGGKGGDKGAAKGDAKK